MTELVALQIPTKFGIDIYSSTTISLFHLYKRVLDESDFRLSIEYKGNKDYEFDDSEEIHITDVANMLNIITSPQTLNRSQDDLNSSRNHKLFELINKGFKNKYNIDIKEHSLYAKYTELQNKIKTTETHINSVCKSFDNVSVTKLQEFNILKFWEGIYTKLNNEDPRIVESIILKRLEEIILVYNNISNEQRERFRLRKREEEEDRIRIDKQHEEEDKRKELEREKVRQELENRKLREIQDAQLEEMKRIETRRKIEEAKEQEKKDKDERLRLKKEEAIKLSQIRKQEIAQQKVEPLPLNGSVSASVSADIKQSKIDDLRKQAEEKRQEILKKKELDKQIQLRNEMREKKLQEYMKKKKDESEQKKLEEQQKKGESHEQAVLNMMEEQKKERGDTTRRTNSKKTNSKKK